MDRRAHQRLRARYHRPYLDQYVRTPNRLAFGERTVIVMSSKVAQKSYGTEKRCVLCFRSRGSRRLT